MLVDASGADVVTTGVPPLDSVDADVRIADATCVLTAADVRIEDPTRPAATVAVRAVDDVRRDVDDNDADANVVRVEVA